MTPHLSLVPGRLDDLRAAMAAHSSEAGGTHALQALPVAMTATGLQAAFDELGVSLTRHQARAGSDDGAGMT